MEIVPSLLSPAPDSLNRDTADFLPEVPIVSPVKPRGIFRKSAAVLGRVTGRMALPAFGACAGAYLMLNGAHSETQIGGMQVETSTDIGFDQTGLTAGVKFQDPYYPDTDLGNIHFPDYLSPLPLGIDIQAYPAASTVEAAIYGRYAYVLHLEADAEEQLALLIDDYTGRATTGIGSGILGGAVANELIAAAYRRRRSSTTEDGPNRPVLTGIGCGTLAVALLGGSGVLAARHIEPDMSHYEADGLIGLAMESPGRFSDIDLRDPVLNSIFRDFQQAHACPAAEPYTERSASSLTVTTYNIKRGEFGLELVAEELLATGSDVILLQEVTPAAVTLLSERLGMQAVTGWTIDDDKMTFGNAILTTLPITYSEALELPSEGVEPRQLLTARLLTPSGEELLAASTHLTNEITGMGGDRNEQLRIAQAREITEVIEDLSKPDEAIVLGGDLNQGTDSAVYRILDEQLTDTLAEEPELSETASFPSNGQRFDVLFTNTDWETENAQRGGAAASDHCLESVTLGMTGAYTVPPETVIQAQTPEIGASTKPN